MTPGWVHHAVVSELRGRQATFTTQEPGEELPERAEVVVSAPTDGVSYPDVAVEHVTTTAETIRGEVASEPDALVRVGDGARLHGARLVNELEDVAVELVDESGTTPSLGTGATGKGLADVLAAVNIARREGEPVETRDVEPTAGEIQRVKNRSRELSDGDRTLDTDLARRVALGELDLSEALTRHREE